MDDDRLFRLILIAAFALLVPVAGYFRFKAHWNGEKLDRRQEGLFLLIGIRLIGMVTMLGLLAFLIEPRWMAWSAVPLPAELRWAGVGIGFLAGLLIIWTFYNLGHNLTDTVVTRRNATLVTTGPYRWVRHPFYVAFALAVLANALVTANAFLLASGVTAFALIVLRTRKEEERLIARFGDEYRQYMRRTGRFFPRLGRPHAGGNS